MPSSKPNSPADRDLYPETHTLTTSYTQHSSEARGTLTILSLCSHKEHKEITALPPSYPAFTQLCNATMPQY